MSPPRPDESTAPVAGAGGLPRESLMERHAVARRQRDAAPLGSDQFRAAAEEVARIEIEIARLEEPPAELPD